MLGEAGLAAHDARPRPRTNRGEAPAQGRRTPGASAWEPARGPQPSREAGVGPRQDAAGTRRQDGTRAYVAHDPASAPRITRCQAGRGVTLLDDRHPRIVVLRRTGRICANAAGACRAVIGMCWQAGPGIATGRVRTGCRGSGGDSAGASPGSSPTRRACFRVTEALAGPPAKVFSRFSPPDDDEAQANPEDDEE